MKRTIKKIQQSAANSVHWASVLALITLAVVIGSAIYADQHNTRAHIQRQNVAVQDQVKLLRTRLEGVINSNLQLVRGLAGIISIEPNLDEAHFAQLAAQLYATDNQLINIAAAPDLIITMVYPLEGNRGALGLNYNENEAQRRAAHRARDTGDVILAGPINLVQGGRGFIGRFPVFHLNEQGEQIFWGLLSTVIDVDELYAASGLTPQLPLDIALTGKDGHGATGEQFYGDPQTRQNNPVTAEVTLPTGTWEIAATPLGGWSLQPPNQFQVRIILLLAAIAIVVPVVFITHLFQERGKNKRRLRVLTQRLELALQASKIGVWEFNASTEELHWDARMREIYGAPAIGEVTVQDWKDGLHPDDLDRAMENFNSSISGQHNYKSEFRVCLPDGRVQHIRTIGNIYQNNDGSTRIVGVNWDATADVELTEQLRRANELSEARNIELEAARSRIEKVAMHDALTGLPNRRYLDVYLSTLQEETDKEFGLLHIDLDRFKQINDTLGHAAGDAVLVQTAQILQSNIRPGDFVARIGGDEFVVVCMPECEEAQLETMAERIIEKMREPVIYEGRPCRRAVSIGVAMSSSCKNDPGQLLVNADIALYRAKNTGRNSHQLFSSALHKAAINTKRVADEILNGIDENQFIAHYQGQFDAHTHEIVGVEALARWNHPEKGLLSPDSFLEIANELNVLPTIDAIILDQSLAQMQIWRDENVCVPRVAVNVSARRLNDVDLVKHLKTLQFEPGTLAFELVESTFLDQSDDLVSFNIDQIRDLGIDLEIDDFGTGYASIVSLMRLRPKVLKIDRQLILPITQSPTQRDLVRSIVEIGRSLDIVSLAEGVETLEHAKIARDLGCSALQGYAFARPMSGQDFATFARKHASSLNKGVA